MSLAMNSATPLVILLQRLAEGFRFWELLCNQPPLVCSLFLFWSCFLTHFWMMIPEMLSKVCGVARIANFHVVKSTLNLFIISDFPFVNLKTKIQPSSALAPFREFNLGFGSAICKDSAIQQAMPSLVQLYTTQGKSHTALVPKIDLLIT